MLHQESASAVFGDIGWYAGWDLDDKIDLAGTEGLGRKVTTPSPNDVWSGLKYFGTHEYAAQLLVDAGDRVTKGAMTPVKNQRLRFVLGGLGHGFP